MPVTEGSETQPEQLISSAKRRSIAFATAIILLAGKGIAKSQEASAGDPEILPVLTVIFLPFIAAALVPVAYRVLEERTAYYAATVTFGSGAGLTALTGILFLFTTAPTGAHLISRAAHSVEIEFAGEAEWIEEEQIEEKVRRETSLEKLLQD